MTEAMTTQEALKLLNKGFKSKSKRTQKLNKSVQQLLRSACDLAEAGVSPNYLHALVNVGIERAGFGL
jgi:hypothetical protein